jgi:hypothetical protein
MTERPSDIPEGVWKGAEDHLQRHSHLLSSTEIVARAVMAEREKCALVAEARKPLYATTGHNGRLVCSEVASSIRAGE